jgi:hypothetical protein
VQYASTWSENTPVAAGGQALADSGASRSRRDAIAGSIGGLTGESGETLDYLDQLGETTCGEILRLKD